MNNYIFVGICRSGATFSGSWISFAEENVQETQTCIYSSDSDYSRNWRCGAVKVEHILTDRSAQPASLLQVFQ